MSTRSRGAIRSNDPIGMRNRVLDVAAQSFQQRGFGATSMHDVVRDAGISGGALYHHFPSKRELALGVVRERVAPELASTWIAAVEHGDSGLEAVIGVFEEVADGLDARGSVTGCPLGNLALELSLADEGLRSVVDTEYRRWAAAIAQRAGDDAERGLGDYAAGDPAGFAAFVVAMFTGAMTVAKASQDAGALRACARQLRRAGAPNPGKRL